MRGVQELVLAKENANYQLALLKSKYNEYNYGTTNYLLITALIDEATIGIFSTNTIAEVQAILTTLNEELDSFKIIKESDGKYNKDDESVDYDSEYIDELYSIVENDKGLEDGVKVVVTKIEISTSIIEDVKNHVKTDDINDFGKNIDKATLKKQGVIAKLEINLVDLNNQILSAENLEGIYKISFLLPEELRNREYIRVVYLDGNNNLIEVFDTTREGNWLIFETEHFSGFYLLANEEEIINLWWIIIILIILISIEIVWVILKKENDKRRLNSIVWPFLTIIIPNHAYLIIIILAIIFIIFVIYITYLYLTTPKKAENEEQTTIVNISNEEKLNQITIEETPIYEENEDVENDFDEDDEDSIAVNIPIVDGNVTIANTPKIRYNYSMIGRIHQAPKESIDRYNQIKNFILSYDDIKSSMHWKYENFVYKGRNAVQLRLQGNTIRVYFDLDYNEFKDSKYNVSFVDSKILSSTPVMMKVKGSRALKYALELIQMTFEKLENKQHKIQNVDYALPYYDLDTLISKGLVKVATSKK